MMDYFSFQIALAVSFTSYETTNVDAVNFQSDIASVYALLSEI